MVRLYEKQACRLDGGTDWRQWKRGEQSKTSELVARSGMELRKIDDLIEA